MANVDVISECQARYDTGSHVEETLASRGTTVPRQMVWSEVHPPGVRVLPKGSAPAGEGEINWEDTLGGQFSRALKRLEGMLYAICGSRPAAYARGGDLWYVVQWYDRINPRCLWFPEIWERRCSFIGEIGCVTEADCENGCHDYVTAEHAALGYNPPCCAEAGAPPSVPIRSRSGDPQEQYRVGAHDRDCFPLGSVARTHEDDSGQEHDPKGFGYFGATQPGRIDNIANPWLDVTVGGNPVYEHEAGESVTFTWTKPAGVDEPDAVYIRAQFKAPGGSWGSVSITAMTESGGVWSHTEAARQHGTECRWLLHYQINEVPPSPGHPGTPAVNRYEPGGETVPDGADWHYFVWFRHYNPFANGLPELLDSYAGVDVRHGTDHYEFDGSETIQPELINLARFVLSWLGGDNCNREYGGCHETDLRVDALHHNPRDYASDHGLCCAPKPLRFRWSGSNAYPHYLAGGKGGTHGVKPLLSTDTDSGSQAARKSWRGVGPDFQRDDFDLNPFWGHGYSWGTAPGTYRLLYRPIWYEDARVFEKYEEVGLRTGDVIEAAHLQEIIDAVDYIIQHGAWVMTDICTRKATSVSMLGITCGTQRHRYDDGSTSDDDTVVNPCMNACTNDCEGDGYCTPYDPPTWSECYSNCTDEKAILLASHTAETYEEYEHGGLGAHGYDETWCIHCDGTTPCNNMFAGDCGGAASRLDSCYVRDTETPYDCIAGGSPDGRLASSCAVAVRGLAYYFCGPAQCKDGWDADHGNGLFKRRYDHDYSTGNLNEAATGPVSHLSGGNCFGDIFACGGESVDFETVTAVVNSGLASGWWAHCSEPPTLCAGTEWALADPPEIPGWGMWQRDAEDNPTYPLCQAQPFEFECTPRKDCTIDGSTFDVCAGRKTWVAINLRLDNTEVAYGTSGEGIPTLSPYDLTESYDGGDRDPASYMHDCPCETQTGATTCT